MAFTDDRTSGIIDFFRSGIGFRFGEVCAWAGCGEMRREGDDRAPAFRGQSEASDALAASEAGLLRATVDGMFDPQVLVEAVRDPDGLVVDLVFRSVNSAACSFIGVAEGDLLGRGVVGEFPNVPVSGLMGQVAGCLSGAPVILEDFPYLSDATKELRRYDMRATQAGAGLIVFTWRDVTQRFDDTQRSAASEHNYRMLAENAADVVCHIRDEKFVWISPSIEGALGAPPEYWLGRGVLDLLPPEDAWAHAKEWAKLSEGGVIKRRMRAMAVDGVTHWAELHAKPFYDADGRRDGVTAALRLIDKKVAAQEEAKAARRQQAKADERYRRSVENAAIGMCLIAPDGRFEEVNEALCHFFGYDRETLTQKTFQELTPPEYLAADLENVNEVLAGRIDSYRMTKQYIHADGHLIWGDLSVSCIRDEHGNVENFISQITDITALVASERNYRLLAENTGDVIVHVRDGRFVWVSPSIDILLGAPAEYWVGRDVREIFPRTDLAAWADRVERVAAGEAIRERYQVIAADGVSHWVEAHSKPFYDDSGRQDGSLAMLRLIDAEVAAEQETEKARKLQARADELYRRSVEHAAIGMCLITPDGGFAEVNDALCQLSGYDAETLMQKTFQEFIAPEYVEASLEKVKGVLDGTVDSYRMLKQYIRSDGHRIWGDLSVSCIRDEHGHVEYFIAQIIDITKQVQDAERSRDLAERVMRQSDLMTHELESAAAYMSSIMPIGLNGKVSAASRYLPSSGLGGDCFDYTWIGDDHFLVYLIDVSGHGIEPALLSVSVHNMIRSGSLANETLREPGNVLTELNRRFQMDQHRGHYFTMWCGVYEASTRTLRYACAGAPPALAFNFVTGQATAMTELSTVSVPVGMFDDTVYVSATYSVPPGCRFLLYSDGAFELEPADGRDFALEDFKNLATRLAGAPDSSIDELVEELRALTPTGGFQDDCSLVGLRFN